MLKKALMDRGFKKQVRRLTGGVLNERDGHEPCKLCNQHHTGDCPIEQPVDTSVHLCDTCKLTYPECDPKDIDFGDGKGDDNIFKCEKYQKKSKSKKGVIRYNEDC